VIDARYRGGWQPFLERWGGAVGPTAWLDQHLFCQNNMDQSAAETDVAQMRAGGLQPFSKVDGEMVWNDLCVADIRG
jgi:hypothetical protein